jgi:hypothetical protein
MAAQNVRFGSLADITTRSRHVRFTPDNGHSSVQVECPKSATSGHLALLKQSVRAAQALSEFE